MLDGLRNSKWSGVERSVSSQTSWELFFSKFVRSLEDREEECMSLLMVRYWWGHCYVSMMEKGNACLRGSKVINENKVNEKTKLDHTPWRNDFWEITEFCIMYLMWLYSRD